jgi:hypothetical protein
MTRKNDGLIVSSLAFAFVALAVPRVALADDAACIAAIETEAPLQKAGRLHEALAQAAKCADPACPVEVRTECSLRIQKMDAAMPTIVLGAADEHGNDLILVHVTLDSVPLVDTLDGKALALDPGSHLLRFEAEGKAPVEKTVVLREGEKDRRVTVALAPEGYVPQAPLPPLPVTPPSTWNQRKTTAVAAGAVGLVGVIVGSVTGGLAISSWSTAKNECTAVSCPPSTRPSAESSRSSAVTLGTVSTVAFVVGGAGLAGGGLLWLTAPKSDAPVALDLRPVLGLGSAGMALTGSFR